MGTFTSARKHNTGRPLSGGLSTRDGSYKSSGAEAAGHTASSAVQTMAEASNRSPRVQSQLELARSLNGSSRAAAQMKLAKLLPVRRGLASGPAQRMLLQDDEETAQAACLGAAKSGPSLEEEAAQGKFATVQREEGTYDEDYLQAKFGVAQREEGTDDEDYAMQAKSHTAERSGLNAEAVQREPSTARSENRTGLPDNLKSGIENLSGRSLDQVKVHYNSSKPAQLNALAYTQGNNIHVGPGEEKHLPHEAWHSVQQAEGRVRPTMQMRGTSINDDAGLEREADVMGARAVQNGVSQMANADGARAGLASTEAPVSSTTNQRHTVQRYLWIADDEVDEVPEDIRLRLPEVAALLESWIEEKREVVLGSWEVAIQEAEAELARSSPSPSVSLSSPMSEGGGGGGGGEPSSARSTPDRATRMLEAARDIRRRAANNNVLWDRATDLITALEKAGKSAGDQELEGWSIDLDDLQRRSFKGAERRKEAREQTGSRKKQLAPFLGEAQRMVAAISEYTNPYSSDLGDYRDAVLRFRRSVEDVLLDVYSLRGGVKQTARQELLSDLDRFKSKEAELGISVEMIKFLVQDPSILDNPPFDVKFTRDVAGQDKAKKEQLTKEASKGLTRSASSAPTWASGELEVYDKRNGPPGFTRPIRSEKMFELSGNVRPIDARSKYQTFAFGPGKDKMVLHERGQEADARVVEEVRELLEKSKAMIRDKNIYVHFTLTTEIHMCASCFLVLQQFRREFPQVAISIRLKR